MRIELLSPAETRASLACFCPHCICKLLADKATKATGRFHLGWCGDTTDGHVLFVALPIAHVRDFKPYCEHLFLHDKIDKDTLIECFDVQKAMIDFTAEQADYLLSPKENSDDDYRNDVTLE